MNDTTLSKIEGLLFSLAENIFDEEFPSTFFDDIPDEMQDELSEVADDIISEMAGHALDAVCESLSEVINRRKSELQW